MGNNTRALWLAITLLTASILGASGGLLSKLGGMNTANAILAGAGAFAGTVLLILAVIHFLAGAEQPRHTRLMTEATASSRDTAATDRQVRRATSSELR